MPKNVKVIMGSVRPNRAGEAVTRWVLDEAARRSGGVDYEVVDLRDLNLPFMDEAMPPASGAPYAHEHTKAWSRVIDAADGFIFVTPEYNQGYSPALKNAVDYLYSEWKDKPAALVGYGADGAAKAIRQLRQVLAFVGLKLQDGQVGIEKIWEAVDENGRVKGEYVRGDLPELLDQFEAALAEPVGAAAG